MNQNKQGLNFLEACQFVGENPYENADGQLRRFSTLSELLDKSLLIIDKSDKANKTKMDFFVHASNEDSHYFIGESISTRAIINEYIRKNEKFTKLKGEPSFGTCHMNWKIRGMKRILQDTKERFKLIKVEVVEQPYHQNEICEIHIDLNQYLLELDDLSDFVDINKAYFFIFTLQDLITLEIKTFAYPIDFKA